MYDYEACISITNDANHIVKSVSPMVSMNVDNRDLLSNIPNITYISCIRYVYRY